MSALGPSPQSNGDYSPPPPPPTESPNGGLATGLPIVLTVGIVMGVLIVIVAVRFCVIRRRKKRRRGDNNGSDGLAHGAEDGLAHGAEGVASKPLMKRGLDLRPSQISFSYEELSIDQFSDANLIGEGGFGLVHKGVLPNGKAVAIKHMKSGSVQGEREFRAEVEIISRVHHKHLVSLIGYCVAGAQRMLVYEFIPNFTLYFHLHGKERPVMNWPTRMKIALGSLQKDWHICTRTVTQRSYIVTSRQLIFFWIKTLTQRLQILGLLSFQQILIPMSPLG